MLKSGLAGLAALCLLAGPSHAEFVYNGFLKIVTVNAACTRGPAVGTVFRAHYHPKNVVAGTQELKQSILTITNNFAVRALKSTTTEFGAASVAVSNTTLNGLELIPVKPGRLSLTNQKPAVLDIASTDVSFGGNIVNFNGMANQTKCVVGYTFSGILRFP